MRDVIVRDAVVADAEAIARVHVASWRAAYRGIVPDDLLDRLSVPARIERARQMLGGPSPGRTFVAEVDGDVLGWCRIGPARDDDPPGETELYALYLAPDARGRGVGIALLREAEARRATYLWTLEANAPARRFYERAGWVPDGIVRAIDLSVAAPGSPPVSLPEVRYRRAVSGRVEDGSVRSLLEGSAAAVSELPYVLVAAVDSSADVAAMPWARSRVSADPGWALSRSPLVVTGRAAVALAREEVFTGFDELWVPGRLPVPAPPPGVTLVEPVRLGAEPPREVAAWLAESGCVAGFGDGYGLNYVVAGDAIAGRLGLPWPS